MQQRLAKVSGDFRRGSRQVEELSGLVGDVAEVIKGAGLADDVEEVAAFPRRGIRPMADPARARPPAPKAHESRGARSIPDVADDPISSGSPAVGEIAAADRLGMAREAVGEVRSRGPHVDAVVLSAMRSMGYFEMSLSRIAEPGSSVGTNILSFHWMISWKRP